MGRANTHMEEWTHCLTFDACKDDWSREFQQKGGPPAAQRRLLTLFPSGLAPSFPPVYIPCTWLVIKREEDVPRILKGIEEAVKDLVATTHAKYGMVATMENVQFAGHAAFSPIHVGRSSMRILWALLHRNVPEVLKDGGLFPRICIFLGCEGDHVIKFRAQSSLTQESIGALNNGSVSLRLRRQLESPLESPRWSSSWMTNWRRGSM